MNNTDKHKILFLDKLLDGAEVE